MQAIILAAGKGSRLGQGDQPKPLTQLESGLSILEWQLEALKNYISLDSVIVVVGYHKQKIMHQFPNLQYVINPDFAKENTSKSLLRALEGVNDDVLWLNGDVVFHPSVLEPFFQERKTSMLVNVSTVGDEEVKYCQDDVGRILEVSKHVKEPLGEALGINLWREEDLDKLHRNLERCALDDYFERGIEFCIEEGMEVWSVTIENDLCTEIDFPEDLERANALIKQWEDYRPQ